MPISIEADPTLAQGYIKVNGTTAATISTAGIVSGGIPAGAIMPFATNSAPSGWLAANGDAVSRSTYAALFAAIGTTHGAGDGSTTFNLPDLRGYFVRGSGTNADGTAAGTFAAKQADELKSHTHSARWLLTTAGVGSSTGGWGSGTAYSNNFTQIEATGGSETRPKNIALLYCIKH